MCLHRIDEEKGQVRPVCPFLSLVQHRPVDSQTVEYSGAIYRLTDSFNFKQKAIDTVTHVSAIYEYKKKVLAVPPRPERNWKSLFNEKSKKKEKFLFQKRNTMGSVMGLAVGYPDEEWAIAGHARDPAFFLAHTHGHYSPFLL